MHSCDQGLSYRRCTLWPIGQTFTMAPVRSANVKVAGVGLGQLLLALDATMVTLVEAPRGLDLPVASAALIDADDVRLGLAEGSGSSDVFVLLGVGDDEALPWLVGQAAPRRPAA